MNDIDKDPQRTPEEGRVKPPYGGAIHCSNSECRGILNEELGHTFTRIEKLEAFSCSVELARFMLNSMMA